MSDRLRRRPKGPLARFVDRALKLGPVRWLIPIIDAHDAAGGGLLASGLAFSSLFAILPSILLIIAVVGVILGDPGRLAAMSTSLSMSFPPLAGFFKVALGGFADGAITYSVIGVVALIWGAGRFHQSLDDAMARARFHVTQLAATCCSSRGWRKWSGRRGSNPRHSAWEADTLPTELLPLGRPWGFTPCAEECTTRRAPHATDGERGTGARSCRRSPS